MQIFKQMQESKLKAENDDFDNLHDFEDEIDRLRDKNNIELSERIGKADRWYETRAQEANKNRGFWAKICKP